MGQIKEVERYEAGGVTVSLWEWEGSPFPRRVTVWVPESAPPFVLADHPKISEWIGPGRELTWGGGEDGEDGELWGEGDGQPYEHTW